MLDEYRSSLAELNAQSRSETLNWKQDSHWLYINYQLDALIIIYS